MQCAVPLRVGLLALDAAPPPLPAPAPKLQPPAPVITGAEGAEIPRGNGQPRLVYVDDSFDVASLPPGRNGTEAERSEARRLFVHASELFAAKAYADSRDAFVRAYRTLPQPAVLLNIAQALVAEGKPQEARLVYEKAANDPTSSDIVKEKVRAALRDLKK
jgi:tetratricopeptide (TPR) repeat protein